MSSLPQRFWDKVDKTASGCWLWTAGKNATGYGYFHLERRGHRAHRLAYADRFGPIPDGLVIDHLCRNRMCVNPDHLEAVTSRENCHRGMAPTGFNARKTHCIHGHELTPENILRDKRHGGRVCRTCKVAATRRYRRRRAEAAA